MSDTKSNIIVGVFLEGTDKLTQVLYGPAMLTYQEATMITANINGELEGLESMYYIAFTDAENYK